MSFPNGSPWSHNTRNVVEGKGELTEKIIQRAAANRSAACLGAVRAQENVVEAFETAIGPGTTLLELGNGPKARRGLGSGAHGRDWNAGESKRLKATKSSP